MTAYKPGKDKDRRKGSDIWIRVLSFLGVTGWLVMLGSMIVADRARPEPETVTTRFHKVIVRTTWDMELATYLFCLMIAGLFISIAGLYINSRRLKRKDDQLRINLILILLISITGIITYLFFL